MGFPSTSSILLSSPPKIAFRALSPRNDLRNGLIDGYCARRVAFPTSFPLFLKRRCIRFKKFTPTVSRLDGGSSRTAGGRRVYKQSQDVRPSPRVPVQELVSLVVPAGVFIVVTFGIALILLPFRLNSDLSSEHII